MSSLRPVMTSTVTLTVREELVFTRKASPVQEEFLPGSMESLTSCMASLDLDPLPASLSLGTAATIPASRWSRDISWHPVRRAQHIRADTTDVGRMEAPAELRRAAT